MCPNLCYTGRYAGTFREAIVICTINHVMPSELTIDKEFDHPIAEISHEMRIGLESAELEDRS